MVAPQTRAKSTPYPLEQPVHDVVLEEFELALWPVTNAEYARFIAAGRSA